jgi:hypothetical protein
MNLNNYTYINFSRFKLTPAIKIAMVQIGRCTPPYQAVKTRECWVGGGCFEPKNMPYGWGGWVVTETNKTHWWVGLVG